MNVLKQMPVQTDHKVLVCSISMNIIEDKKQLLDMNPWRIT